MKNKDNLPIVFFNYLTFVKIVIEMQKFYRIGLINDNRPWEAVSYPLAFIKTKQNISPFEMISLFDIESVIISHALFPDDEFKNYSPSRASFDKGVNENMLEKVSPLLLKYPKLDFCCKLHSHPNGTKFLSKKDKDMTLLALSQQKETGLNTNFHFIMTCEKESWQDINSWQIHAYAINQNRDFLPLSIEFIYQNNLLLKEALNPPFYKSKLNYFWLNKFVSFVNNETDYKAEICELYRGWASWCIYFNNHEIHICFPPDFPSNSEIKIIYFGKETEVLNSIELSSCIIYSYYNKTIEQKLIDKILTLKKE